MAGARRQKGRIYKRGKAGNYYVEFYVNGQRIQKRLLDEFGQPITDKRLARKRADVITAPLLAGEEVAIKKAVFNSLKDAQEVARQAEERAKPKTPLSDLWRAYIGTTTRPDSGERTLNDYKGQIQTFLNWCFDSKGLDKAFVVDLDKTLADEYARHLLTVRAVSNNTFNKHLSTLKLVFKHLVLSGRGKSNIFDHIKKKQKSIVSKKNLSLNKAREIYELATGEYKLLILLGIYTGARLGDCCLMKWSEVDLVEQCFLFSPAKTKSRTAKTLRVPIFPELLNILKELGVKAENQSYLLPALSELYRRSPSTITKKLKKIFISAGVEIYAPKGESVTGKRARALYGFHSFRHTFVTLHQQAGTPLAVVQAMVGHNTNAVTNIYTHIGTDSTKKAINALPSLITDKTTSDTERELRERLKALADTLPLEQIEKLLNIIE